MLLTGVAYDPGTAVILPTTAALAMTAMDTTNLRKTFTAPASGIVNCLLSGVVHGATAFPQILLGIMNGSTVMGRMAPEGPLGGTALATTMQRVSAWVPVFNLTPGQQYTFDAAYGVETGVANTGLKYGGPNDTTANNGFGAFVFKIYQET